MIRIIVLAFLLLSCRREYCSRATSPQNNNKLFCKKRDGTYLCDRDANGKPINCSKIMEGYD